jgi:hypothetical protein
MRRIPIVAAQRMTRPDGKAAEDGPLITMAAYVDGLLQDPKAVATFAALCKSLEVRAAFCASGDIASLTEANWEHLCALVREPTGGYTPGAYGLISYMRAILDAPNVEAP